MLQELVLATQNPGKIAELQTLLRQLPIRVLGLGDAGGPFPEPIETGATFEQNASLKALEYARLTGKPCLADDSGLEVDALGGAPGVDSAWYAYRSESDAKSHPRQVRDPENNAKLLRQLVSVEPERRTARFVCTMVLAVPDSRAIIATSRGTFEGRIGSPPRVPAGVHGFGYDPLFLVAPRFKSTSAELTPDQKNAVSHRAVAARDMARQIAELIRRDT